MKAGVGETPKQLVERLDQLYHAPQMQRRPPEQSPVAQALVRFAACQSLSCYPICLRTGGEGVLVPRSWLGGAITSLQARQALHTAYHRREASTTAKLRDW